MPRSRPSVGLLMFCVHASAAASLAQADWTRLSPDTPTRRYGHGMAYDVARQRVVMFRGWQLPLYEPDTWEWNGSTWLQRAAAVMPTALNGYGFAFDADRNRTVLYGTLGAPDHTWEWDGAVWRQMAGDTGRSRHSTAMAYHRPSRRVVRFGGADPASQVSADTWEWSGTGWVQRATAAAPSARASHAMAFDEARGVVVLFGGRTNSGSAADTWEWDGANWQPRASPTSPPARSGHAMCYDPVRQRVVLFGGAAFPTVFDDTWEWNGTDWTQRPTARRPAARNYSAMAFDGASGRALLFGGEAPHGPLHDTWAYDGVDWQPVQPGAPYPRTGMALAPHPSRPGLVAFGGSISAPRFAVFNDTWTWDANGWQPVATSAAPPPRQGAAIAADPYRRNVVLFGGATFTTQWVGYGDTWTFDGANWSQRFPVHRPPSRTRTGAAALDPVGGRVLLVGDLLGTWAWDGSEWEVLRPAVEPPPRFDHALATDHRRRRVIMFGGRLTATSQWNAETWEWNGNEWRRLTPGESPAPRGRHVMTWDPVRERIVLNGGDDGGSTFADTWEWDGQRWSRRQPATPVPALTGQAMCADRHTGALLLFGYESQTWSYATATPATLSAFGAGCAGPAGTPLLEPLAGSLPWLGDHLQLHVSRLPDDDLPALLHLGFSRTAWRGLVLPFDLGPFGMPGCTLWTGADAVFPLETASGRAQWSLPIGTEPQTLGIEFFAQAVAAARSVNPAGFVVSNAVAGRTGAR